MKSKIFNNIITLSIFVVCFWTGCQLSLHKPLWGDEIYTQVYSIEGSSWSAILEGKFPEGYNTPLYYLLQKAFLSASNYHLPFAWIKPVDGKIADEYSQVLLRLTANTAMSLAIALIGRYFLVKYSLKAFCLSLLSCFSSYMVLVYWLEARPYALWFLLTTLQILLLLNYSSFNSKKSLKWISIVQCALGMTAIVSAAQVLICSLWLWRNGIKSIHQHILLTVLPLCFCIYYFFAAFGQGTLCHYKATDPFKLMHEAFALDHLLLLLILGMIFWCFKKLKGYSSNFKSKHGQFLVFCAISFLLTAIALIGYVKMTERPWEITGILDSRYLIFLAPVEIISVTYFIISIFRFLRDNHAGLWIGQFIVLVSFFYMIRFLLVYQDIYSRAVFAY